MEQLRLAIVGLGRFAQLHIDCLRQIQSVTIVAVCDIRAGQADEWARRLNCKGYTDLQELLRCEAPDALDVLTPEANHYNAVMEGLQAGCHIFVEKPLDIDPAKAGKMIAFADERGRQLMVGHITRFDPRCIAIKQSLARGEIGRIRSLYTRRSDKREYFGIYKRSPVVFILGVHDIDQILWYMNEIPAEVYAKQSSSVEGADLINAMMTFRDGTVAMMDCNWLAPGSWPASQDLYTQIAGDKGILRTQNPDHSFSLCSDDLYRIPDIHSQADISGRIEGPLMSELRHFAECVLQSRPSAILLPGDALNVIRVAAAILRSCESGRPEEVTG